MQTLQLSRRLVDVGETIAFSFPLDVRAEEVELRIFPCYLRHGDPQLARASVSRLAWLDGLPSVAPPFSLVDGVARGEYTPEEPGSYLARLRTPWDTFYRYFAAVTPEYLVYRMLAYSRFQPPLGWPEIRQGGIPIDWTMHVKDLPVTLDPDRGHLEQLLEYQRVFGDVVMPFFSTAGRLRDDPDFDLDGHLASAVERMRSAGLHVERTVLDWQACAAAIEVYRRQGFDVIDGLIPEIEEHRGGPWFPYWMSDDFLSPAAGPAQMLGMIMDFCAGFHFHGPPDFHMLSSECNWGAAAAHVEMAAREHLLIGRNSGSGPVFVPTLLTFRYSPWGRWPERHWPEEQQVQFVRSFLDDTAFILARNYPIAFARGVDIADYLRDHPGPQPRRVLSSITHDWPYDRNWSPEWCHAGVDVHRGALPFGEALADIRNRRPFVWAKPTAKELIYCEDARSQCRFEYRCPKPLLWYEYADHRRTGPLAGRPETAAPDPHLELTTWTSATSFKVTYRISGGTPFPDYKLAIWDIPREFAGCPATTNAKEFVLVENADGDYRGLLVFDLKPEMSVSLSFSRSHI